mmetsp:Transcript_47588/g.113093  ORF Transcript_47588/g.113093 Transcript_47588/m.113093 type:complete len:301 (-) Transcript_47588:182-1084(-)
MAVSMLSNDADLALELQRSIDFEEAIDKVVSASFTCPICMEMDLVDNSMELDCSHRFCRDCFVNYLEGKVSEKSVDEQQLCCPMPKCKCAITDMQVEGALKGTSRKSWNRFLDSRLERWTPSEKGEVRCDCPKCATPFTVSHLSMGWEKRATEVSCPDCSTSFCPCCGGSHPGLSCEEHQARERQNPEQLAFEEYVKEQGLKSCPVCGVVCEREQGCNYMTCPSAKCRGQTHFCYICGDQLKSGLQHLAHFPYGPYQDVCHGCSVPEPQNQVEELFQTGLRRFDAFLQRTDFGFGFSSRL